MSPDAADWRVQDRHLSWRQQHGAAVARTPYPWCEGGLRRATPGHASFAWPRDWLRTPRSLCPPGCCAGHASLPCLRHCRCQSSQAFVLQPVHQGPLSDLCSRGASRAWTGAGARTLRLGIQAYGLHTKGSNLQLIYLPCYETNAGAIRTCASMGGERRLSWFDLRPSAAAPDHARAGFGQACPLVTSVPAALAVLYDDRGPF